MFYFSDYESYIEINPLLTTEKAFQNGFGIAIWFRIEYSHGFKTGEEYPSLFSIYCHQKGGFEAYFEGNTLYYKTINGKAYEHGPSESSEEVYTFDTERWYQLFIGHDRKYLVSEIKFMVDGVIVKEKTMEYPKMDKIGKLDVSYLCRNMTGQVSSILIFNDHVKTKNVLDLFRKFPKDVDPERFLDELDKNSKFKEDKVREKLFSVFVPSRAQVHAATDSVYVEFGGAMNKGRLGKFAGVFCQERQK